MTLQELVDYMKPDFLDRCDRCPPDNDIKDGCKYVGDKVITNCLICKKDFIENRYKDYEVK
jgi:hypothetical protein